MKLGGKAHLGVDDPVLDQVLDALGRDALERLASLHHADGVGEARQVAHQVVSGRSRHEPRRELLRIGRRQLPVALFGGELHHRCRPQAAVEVIVEEHFRRAADLVEPKPDAHAITSSTTGPGSVDCSPMEIAPLSASRAQSRRSD